MKYTTTLLLATLLSASTFAAFASPDAGRMEKRMERMTKSLELNEKQQQQMREIMKRYMEKRKAIKEEKINKIKSILTPEQQKKFEKHRAERKARRQERRENRKKNCEHNKDKATS